MAATMLLLSGCNQGTKPAQNEQPQTQMATAHPIQIGGEDVVTLIRKASEGGKAPEFLSATMLPGRGMNVFQITASIPGRGITELLSSPSLTDASQKLNGGTDDLDGNASFSFGGAFLVPYPNRIRGKLSADGQTVTTSWKGHTLTLPANWKGKNPGAEPHAMHGLINNVPVTDLKTETTSDGQTLTGVIHAGDFGGHWLSSTDLNFTIALEKADVEVIITAKNVGKEAEPMAIGWHPYFAIPSGDRSQARLHIPAADVVIVNNYDDVFPTGKLKPVKGTDYDYNEPDGKPLDGHFLDDNFSHLTRTGGNVDVVLTDPKASYGLHVLGESPEIKTVQVYAPKEKAFTAIEEQFNFGDPFGKEWKGKDTGMVTLKPGASVTWKVKLALSTPAK
ncbi:MAG: aldose 1-epimerase [Acidobacteriaceae bacterium]